MLRHTFAKKMMRTTISLTLVLILSGCIGKTEDVSLDRPTVALETNIVKGCNALNEAKAKLNMEYAQSNIVSYSVPTNVFHELLEEARAKEARASVQYKKWNWHVQKYGHVHKWPKHTERESSEQSTGE